MLTGRVHRFFYADHCSLTACCYKFCRWSQMGKNEKLQKLFLLGVTARLHYSVMHFSDVIIACGYGYLPIYHCNVLLGT